jgi:hypothetical protein
MIDHIKWLSLGGLQTNLEDQSRGVLARPLVDNRNLRRIRTIQTKAERQEDKEDQGKLHSKK